MSSSTSSPFDNLDSLSVNFSPSPKSTLSLAGTQENLDNSIQTISTQTNQNSIFNTNSFDSAITKQGTSANNNQNSISTFINDLSENSRLQTTQPPPSGSNLGTYDLSKAYENLRSVRKGRLMFLLIWNAFSKIIN